MKYYEVRVSYIEEGKIKTEDLIIDDPSDLGGIFRYGDCTEGEIISFYGVRKVTND